MLPVSDPTEALTAYSRRQFIKYSISDDLWKTLKANQIQPLLSEMGIGIRRQDMLSIRREKLAEFVRRDDITEYGRNRILPDDLMTQKTDIRMTRDFQYRYKITALDPKTNKEVYIYRGLSTNKILTPQQGEEIAGTRFTAGGEGYNYTILSVELHEVWKDAR